MGKHEDDNSNLPVSSSSSGPTSNRNSCCGCCSVGAIVSLKCVVVLIVGVAVMLSAVFWLPPFLGRGSGTPQEPDPQFGGADIVATFKLQKPVSLLNSNVAKLQYDIYEEIGVPNSSVEIISLEPLSGLNWTNVVFSIWPFPKSSNISSAGLSIIKSNFEAFVTRQSTLHLTTSLFGNTYFFEMLKFPGGITITPPQSGFLLQKGQMLFNFTLNFPIYVVQDHLGELKAQMKSGLLLNSYENLYVRLTNLKGTTEAPPTVVQAIILLAVGNDQPSITRLKQLAQTIRSSSGGNLGLNHTVFGKVKQIQLSSYFQRSLNSGGNSISLPPSPAPQPQLDHHHHRHRHHHQHHHQSDTPITPAPAPRHTYHSPAPSPITPAPSPCNNASPSRHNRAHVVPAAAPVASAPHLHASPPDINPPAPAPHLLPASPLPHVAFSHARPPSKSVTTEPPDRMPSKALPPSPSSEASQPFAVCWILALLLYLLAHL